MGRKRAPDFFPRLIDAALRVFAERGVKAARIADIADRMGVGHGTLYNYVDSKDAVFWLLVDRGLATGDDHAFPEDLPVTAPPQERVLARIGEQLATHFALPKLDEAVARSRAPDPHSELIGVIEELYDRTVYTRRFASALERSALDLPELYRLFFASARRALFGRFERLIAARTIEGQLRADTSSEVAARFLVETVTFFGRHRFADPDPMAAPDDVVRRQVVALLVQSFAPETP